MGCTMNAKKKVCKDIQIMQCPSNAAPMIKFKTDIADNSLSDNLLKARSASLVESDFLFTPKKTTDTDLNFIKQSLSKIFLFSILTEEQRETVVSSMKYCTLNAFKVLFQQGNLDPEFFILISGKLEVLINGKHKNILLPMESFGEMSLLHIRRAPVTVRALESSSLWTLKRQNFRSIIEKINSDDYFYFLKILELVPVFNILSPGQKELLVNSINVTSYLPNEEIISEEGNEYDLFIVKEGRVECKHNDESISILKQDEYFGGQIIVDNTIYAVTVTAIEATICYAFHSSELVNILGIYFLQLVYKNFLCLAINEINYFKNLTLEQKRKIIWNSKFEQFENNAKAFPVQTIKKDKIIIIIKGEIKQKDGKTVYKANDVIGYEELLRGEVIGLDYDFYADGDAIAAEIASDKLCKIVGCGLSRKGSQEKLELLHLKDVFIFKNLSQAQAKILLQILKTKNYADGEEIYSPGDPGDSLYIIKSGEVHLIKNGQITRKIAKNSYFGEKALFLSNNHILTAKAHGQTSCWILQLSDYQNLDLKLQKKLFKRFQLKDTSVSRYDFFYIEEVIREQFSHVFLVVHKRRQTLYTIKCVSNEVMKLYQLEDEIEREKEISLEIDHAFIKKLITTYKDIKRVYFLSEFLSNISLSDVMKELNDMPLPSIKFYIACTVLFLEYMHKRDIVYRRLNPKNISIDEEGYPKFINLSSAKKIKGRTYTMIETLPHYLAPEIILGKGYGLSVDYWSLGVMIYELLYKTMPFGDNETDIYRLYKIILQGNLRFPQISDNKGEVKDLIIQLLNKNPAVRLGGSFKDIKNHPWFIEINWKQLLNKDIIAPYLPDFSEVATKVEEALENRYSLEQAIIAAENSEID
ncbi:hypothetical protein SteCoe_20841 [Stentor coeruleus]|uniref:cGMP-dependent protein kinase n=1 Tax=Stentor coeruleus TaxID=5963 RepID=A0A1R2BQT1_9CILI|nr:hypothetical protein SteCoe_20841 [Stentor coeruleus]